MGFDESKERERWRCRCSKQGCNGKCPNEGTDRYDNEGIYCTRVCDKCWKHSGYRVATEPSYRFDPTYAGESLEEDY
jgi:hypothetical protein